MGKGKKERVIQPPSSDDSYFSEEDEEHAPQQAEIREVNRANILNYESDSSDDNEGEHDSSLDVVKANTINPNAAGKDEAHFSNNPWGANKKSFYKQGDSDNDVSSSEAELDMQKEADRLAEIRRAKIAKQMARRQQQEEVVEAADSGEEAKEVASDSESEDLDVVKLGNRLFDDSSDEEKKTAQRLLKSDPVLARAILEQDSPELKQLLQELTRNLKQLNGRIKPLLKEARKQGLSQVAQYLDTK